MARPASARKSWRSQYVNGPRYCLVERRCCRSRDLRWCTYEAKAAEHLGAGTIVERTSRSNQPETPQADTAALDLACVLQ